MERINPCHVQFLYVPVKKGEITDMVLRVKMDSFLPPSHDVKSSQKHSFLPVDKNKQGDSGKKVKNWQKELLLDVLKFPLSSTSKRYERLRINPKFGNKYKKELISEGLIKPKDIALKNCRIILLELTQKGKAILRDLGYEVRNEREGVIHRFWKEKIAQYYKKKGYSVLVEEHINGRPDIVVIGHGAKMAVEIETGSSEFVQNIEKDLKAGFDGVMCVATDKQVEEKISQELHKKNLANRVKITSVFSFDIL